MFEEMCAFCKHADAQREAMDWWKGWRGWGGSELEDALVDMGAGRSVNVRVRRWSI